MRWAVLAAAGFLAAACSATGTGSSTAAGDGGGQAAPPSISSASPASTVDAAGTASASGANWPEYNGNPARTGVAAGIPPAGALTTAWTARLDGAVYGQPLVVGNAVIAATENDSVYALNRATGKVIWGTHLGTPVLQPPPNGCGNVYPLGITGTPVYDASSGLVYAVAEVTGYHHMLVALSATTGAVKLHRSLDIPTSANQPAFNQQRPGLAIAGGRVYATFGGLAGDCGPYQGSIVSAPLTGNGPLTNWVTPTTREGAIWAPGGPVTGPDGNLWVSIGNGESKSGAYDGSDSVTEFSPALQRIAYFAPGTWAADNAGDLDLGSTQPVLAAANTVFIVGKRGVGYLLDGTHLGGTGGELAQQKICGAYGAAAVSGSTVYEPCRDGSGVAAVQVSAATKTVQVLWHGPGSAQGSPVVGGGAVWVTDYNGGVLYELNQSTGAITHQIAVSGGLPHFSSMALSGSTAYVSTLSGITAINGA